MAHTCKQNLLASRMPYAALIHCMHAEGSPRAYCKLAMIARSWAYAMYDGMQKQAINCGQVRERAAEHAHAGLEVRLAALQQRFDARESRAEDLAQIAEAQADARGTRAELAALQARMAQQARRTQPTRTCIISITSIHTFPQAV